MTQNFQYRLVQEAQAITKSVEGEGSFVRVRQTVLETDTMPTDEELLKQINYVDRLADQARLGYNRTWAVFEPLELRIEALRMGYLMTALARIGLGRLIPYDVIEVVDRDGLQVETESV